MISELKDEEILDFLMTSEFEDNYKPEEYKYLLSKWRYFYRVVYGKLDSTKVELEGQINKLQDELTSVKVELNKTKSDLVQKNQDIEQMKFKKLTWKERISGKINIQNEN